MAKGKKNKMPSSEVFITKKGHTACERNVS